MSLIDQLKAEEDKKNKTIGEITVAATFLKRNIQIAEEAATEEERENALSKALEDAEFIEKKALSVFGTQK